MMWPCHQITCKLIVARKVELRNFIILSINDLDRNLEREVQCLSVGVRCTLGTCLVNVIKYVIVVQKGLLQLGTRMQLWHGAAKPVVMEQ